MTVKQYNCFIKLLIENLNNALDYADNPKVMKEKINRIIDNLQQTVSDK